MKYLLVGLGNLGVKRKALLGNRCVATVDPYNPQADFRDLRECDPKSYEAVILSIPNQAKLELLRLSLQMKKHVLVEKPLLFPHEAVVQEFEQLAQINQVICYTSYNHRFEPYIMRIKSELEKETIGKLYYGRLFYGNGTVGDVVGSWREEGLGVLEDLGSHLLDLCSHFLKTEDQEIIPWTLERHGSKTLDHSVLQTKDKKLILEISFLSWKNNFTIDLYGEKGSIHMKGLCKWGPSELVIYKRVLPSGIPHEQREVCTDPDTTWIRDLEHFEKKISEGVSSFKKDWWISQVLQKIGGRA